jgi:hypothetical protein
MMTILTGTIMLNIHIFNTPERQLQCEWEGKHFKARNPAMLDKLLTEAGVPPRKLFFDNVREPVCPRCGVILLWQMDSSKSAPKRPSLKDSGYRCPDCYLWVAHYPSKWVQSFMEDKEKIFSSPTRQKI